MYQNIMFFISAISLQLLWTSFAAAKPTDPMEFALVEGTKAEDSGLSIPVIGALKTGSAAGLGVCTATLVCSNVVLTAAHCVVGPNTANKLYFTNRKSSAYLNEPLRDGSVNTVCNQDPQCAGEAARWFHPGYQKVSRTGKILLIRKHDIALVQLDKSLTLSTFPEMNSAIPPQCTDLGVAGYGRTDADVAGTADDLHYGVVKFEGLEKVWLTNFWPTEGTYRSSPSELEATYNRAPHLAHGDSGGPLFKPTGETGRGANGEIVLESFEIIGVASVIPPDNLVGSLYGDKVQFHAPIVANLDAINAKLAEWCE